MDERQIWMQIEKLVQSEFNAESLPKAVEALSLGDLDEWDSVGNLNFLLAVESTFGIRFSAEDIAKIKSTQEAVDRLLKKIDASE